MLETTFKKIFGTKHDREMKRLQPMVDAINALEPETQGLSDDALKNKTAEFKKRYESGETLDDMMVEAFAVCREAAVRVLGMRHYDVQLIGGMTLHSGKIAEMRTGEGKTLVATLAVYLNALSGKGVHVVTVNDYLATRDAAWMGRLYSFLGLTTSVIMHSLNDRERQEAYAADITYCTNNELGFDYLRDNMKFRLEDYVQRELNFAIIDECDSILIDEARTPLIISGPAEDNTQTYLEINKIIPKLKPEIHFVMEEKSRTASLTEQGGELVEKLLGIENLYDPQHISTLHHVSQGLKAHHLFRKDIDYMVKNDEIVIVDEFTGRLMQGRRWSDGLHQAIEAKEGVRVKSENQTLASITFQNYFRMYNKLSGMTGTADTEAEEFRKIYGLDVTVIPTNKPIAREDLDDEIYKHQQAKFNAIIKDIQERQAKGQPILVGTVSIEKSEQISKALQQAKVPHKVLNAKHHEKEAEIIAQAGRKGAVTIATNMAGRGTDIVLGGNPEFLARAETPADQEIAPELLQKYQEQCELEKREVLEAGGLYIIGTERHDSRRIDNQLRGRSGRQGDPGASKFYLALDDNLMRIFNGERVRSFMDRFNFPEDEAITAPMVSRTIENSQKKVEGHNFDIRKNILEYDDVMNQQRQMIYKLRRRVLSDEDTEQIIKDFMGDVSSELLDNYANEGVKKESWDIEALSAAVAQQFAVKIDFPDITELDADKVTETVSSAVKAVYEKQREALGPHWEELKKMLSLQAIDQHWKEHLQRVDQLREGISLRSYAQKNPLIEYKKEAFNLFQMLNIEIAKDVLEKLFRVQLVSEEATQQMEQMRRAQEKESFRPQRLNYSDGKEAQSTSSTANQILQGEASGEARERQRIQLGSRKQAEEPKLNRAQRRKMKKNR